MDEFISKLKNRHDKKLYILSTRKSITGYWETAVYPTYFFGMFRRGEPVLVIQNRKREDAEKAHELLEEKIMLNRKEKW